MRRRELLAASGSAVATGLAGCAVGRQWTIDVERDDPADDRHPFAGRTVSVRVVDESTSAHDLERNARESLEYWTEYAPTWVDFTVDFDVEFEAGDDTEDRTDGRAEVSDPDGEQPDLVVRYVDSPDPCRAVENYSEWVLGCAPILRAGQRIRRPVIAYVVASSRPYGSIRTTTKHEIGHVLGLGHDDEPLEIMSNRPEHRIPMYQVRIDVWEHVLRAGERAGDGTRLFEHGVSTWNERQYEAAEAAFLAAHEEYVTAGGHVTAAIERTGDFEVPDLEETLDVEALGDHLDRLARRMAAAQGFTSAMATASASAGDEDLEVANERVREANDHLSTFNEIGTVELRDVAIALGLVRGFERDDPVVDVDEGELESEDT